MSMSAALAFRRGGLVRRICSGSGRTPDAVARPPPSQPRPFSPPGLVRRICSEKSGDAVARSPPSQPRPFSPPGLVRRICSEKSGDAVALPFSLPIDRLALVRKMERHGILTKHAEVISSCIISITEQQKSRLSKFNSELENSTGQLSDFENQSDLWKADIEKLCLEFKLEVEKLNSEFKLVVEKKKSDQRNALDIEVGRIHVMLEEKKNETNVLFSKLHHDVQTYQTKVEASKNDMLKYSICSIGFVVSAAAFTIAVFRYMDKIL